jgi:hypothetical protein
LVLGLGVGRWLGRGRRERHVLAWDPSFGLGRLSSLCGDPLLFEREQLCDKAELATDDLALMVQ